MTKKSFGILLLSCAAIALPHALSAQDDIYYDPDSEPETEEEAAAQPSQIQGANGGSQMADADMGRHAQDDSIIANGEDEYEYSRRLNRFHDADLPIYSNEGEGNVTNVYVVGSPYYTPYYNPYYYGTGVSVSLGLGWYDPWYRWDPWWDGYYYRHSHYWGPARPYYGCYYGHDHYYGHRHYHPYYRHSAPPRAMMRGNRAYAGSRGSARGSYRGGSRTASSTRSYSSPSGAGRQIRGEGYGSGRGSYSGPSRGGRTSSSPSSTRAYSSPGNGGGSHYNGRFSSGSQQRSYSGGGSSTRSYSGGGSSHSGGGRGGRGR